MRGAPAISSGKVKSKNVTGPFTDVWAAAPTPAARNAIRTAHAVRITIGICRAPERNVQCPSCGGGELPRVSRRAALAQHVEGNAMTLVRCRDPAIERDQQQNLADLLCGAAIGERAIDVDTKLARASDRRRHGDR